MTGADLAQVIGAIGGLGALIAAIGTVIIGVHNSRKADAAALAAAVAADEAKRAKLEIISTKDGVFELGRKLDGRLTALIKAKDEAAAAAVGQARAEGHAAGVGDEQTRTAKVLSDLAAGPAPVPASAVLDQLRQPAPNRRACHPDVRGPRGPGQAPRR